MKYLTNLRLNCLLITCLFLLILNPQNNFAQENKESKFKVSAWSLGYDVNLARPNNHTFLPLMQGGSLSIYFKNNVLFTGSYKASRTFNSDNYPHDYTKGLDFGLSRTSEDRIQAITLSGGKVIDLNKGLLRFVFEGGLSLIQYKEANYIPIEPRQFLSPSHWIDYPDIKSGMGLNLRAKAELNWAFFTGLFLLAEGNINKFQSYCSLGLGIHFGKVRQRLKL